MADEQQTAEAQGTSQGEAPSIPDGYIHRDEIAKEYVPRTYYESEIQRVSERFSKSARDKAREELMQDEGLVRQILDKHGSPEVDISKHYQQWEAEKLSPVVRELDTLRGRVVQAELVEAARKAGVAEHLLTSPVPGTPPLIVGALMQQVQLTDSGEIIATDSKGNPLPSSSGDRTYASVSELLERYRKDPAWQPYFQAERITGGAGYKGTNGAPRTPSKDVREWSRDEKLAFVEANGAEAYRKLIQRSTK